MNLNKAIVPIMLGLTLSGVSAALVYLIFRKNDEDLDEKYLAIKTSRPALIEVQIPRDCVGVIIGRGGSNIKSIQDQTNTKIHFKDELETDEFRVCVIRGTADSAQVAEFMIRDLILNQPLIETVEIKIPQRAVGRIIGKGGETIRSISRASNAKITVENISQTDDKAFMDRRVIIKGSVEQISLAKSMIEEKVEEDSEERRNIERSMASRSPRQHPNKQYLTSAAQEELKNEKNGHLERLVPTGKDGFMEVYVSAVEGPSQFWLQVYGPRAIELDHLEMQMTDYYKIEENRKLHAIKELEEGQIVAAPFLYDNKWYRAEVAKVTLDDYNVEDSKVCLYYVDYGDTSTRYKHEVCELRTDFLRLRFQAIECCLARVKPSGDEWTDEAIDMFEELARVAKWELMMARVNCYKERSSKRAKRAGSPVPCVELYDTSNKQDINIAEELVKHGFAVWEEEKDQILTSPHKPISGHQAEGPSTHSSLELNGHSKTPLHMESVVSPSEDKTGMFSMKD